MVIMKTHKTLIILCIILVIIAPFLFSLPALCPCFDFSNTGEIGSTIGGITQPFIGVLSIYLLFITLKEQVEINKKNLQHQDFDNALTLINNIDNDLKAFECQIQSETIIGITNINYRTYDEIEIPIDSIYKIFNAIDFVDKKIRFSYNIIKNNSLKDADKNFFITEIKSKLSKIEQLIANLKNDYKVTIIDNFKNTTNKRYEILSRLTSLVSNLNKTSDLIVLI